MVTRMAVAHFKWNDPIAKHLTTHNLVKSDLTSVLQQYVIASRMLQTKAE